MRLGDADARAQPGDAFVGDAAGLGHALAPRLGEYRTRMRCLTERPADDLLPARRFPTRSSNVAGDATYARSTRGARRRTSAAHLRRARRRGGHRRPRALIASGVEPGDRVAIWAPNTTEWVHRRARRATRRGGVIVPLNTRFKGAEAAYILDRARRQAAVHRHRLPRHQLRRAAARRPSRSPSLEQIVVLRGAPRRRHDRLGRRSSRAPSDVADVGGRGAQPRRSPATRSPTSSSRRAPPAGRRARCSRTVRACRRTTRGRPSSACARATATSIVNPFFHAFGLKAGILASLDQGRDDRPARGVRRRHGDAARRRGAHLDAARAAHDVPVDPRPPARRRVRPVVAAPRGHRRRAGAGRADPAHARGAEVRDRRHRLRAHRGDRHRDDVPPRRRPRDDLEDRGPRDPRHRGDRRRRRQQARCRRASPARSSSAATT